MPRTDRYASKVDLEVSNSSNGQYGAERSISISIRDRPSGQLIVEVPLSADQLLAALAGTFHGNMPAWVIPAERRALIGLMSQHREYRVPSDSTMYTALDALDHDRRKNNHPKPSDIGRSDISPDLEALILELAADGDWTEWRVIRHNYGWAVHFIKYVRPEDARSLCSGDYIVGWVGEQPQS